MDADVIILKAGIYGLAAARVLSDAGKRVIALGAWSRIGGRILTHHHRSIACPIEFGAAFELFKKSPRHLISNYHHGQEPRVTIKHCDRA